MNNVSETSTNFKKTGNPKVTKFWTILLTLLVLLIPVGFLFGIISDREDYKKEAVNTVAASWGNVQTFDAPSMYFEQKVKDNVEYKYLPLRDYTADVNLTTEVRKKGLFKVPVYTANVVMKGHFVNGYGDLKDKQIKLTFGVQDSTGFIEEPLIKLNENEPVSVQDTEYTTILKTTGTLIPFEISYKIRGLDNIYVGLGGQSNKVKISGNWKDPSFDGNFLPSAREVGNENFSAEWSVPQIAISGIDNAKVGVSLLTPVDNYRMANRCLKYAFLFLSLTFLSYFIYEITAQKARQIHPLQYLMLGGAMLIFYLLLVSMSEFMPFLAAYTISALMIITLIGMYTFFVITKRQNLMFSAIISLLMMLLYTFLYILLSLQDFALLIGSLGLFIIIAGIMYVTRNVDWYNEG